MLHYVVQLGAGCIKQARAGVSQRVEIDTLLPIRYPWRIMLDCFTGCILGLACGDALGATLEFESATTIRRRFGELRDLVGGGWLRLAPGQYTDDTQMMRCMLESILAHGAVQPADIAARFVTWLESNPPDVGNLTRQAIGHLQRGVPWQEAGKRAWEAGGRSSAGNGGVMRCAPIGLLRADNPAQLAEDSRTTCLITHYDPRCQDSCVALNWAIARLVHGETPDLDELAGLVSESVVAYVREAITADRQTLAEQYASGYTLNPLATAFWALRNADSLEEGIVAVANLGDDADTNAAVTGALLGARYGASALPQRWLATLPDRAELESLATRLYHLITTAGYDSQRNSTAR